MIFIAYDINIFIQFIRIVCTVLVLLICFMWSLSRVMWLVVYYSLICGDIWKP